MGNNGFASEAHYVRLLYLCCQIPCFFVWLLQFRWWYTSEWANRFIWWRVFIFTLFRGLSNTSSEILISTLWLWSSRWLSFVKIFANNWYHFLLLYENLSHKKGTWTEILLYCKGKIAEKREGNFNQRGLVRLQLFTIGYYLLLVTNY